MTKFDLYVKNLEDKRRELRNRALNGEILRRIRMRSEEEAFAALLSLSLFRKEEPEKVLSAGAEIFSKASAVPA